MTGPRGGYCEYCKHAKWAHNGIGHEHTGDTTGCDLCQCKKYIEPKQDD